MKIEKLLDLSKMMEKLAEHSEVSARELPDLEDYSYHAVLANFKRWSKEGYLKVKSQEVYPRLYTVSFDIEEKGIKFISSLFSCYLKAIDSLIKRKRVELTPQQAKIISKLEEDNATVREKEVVVKQQNDKRNKKKSRQEKVDPLNIEKVLTMFVRKIKKNILELLREHLEMYITPENIKSLEEEVLDELESSLFVFFEGYDVSKKGER